MKNDFTKNCLNNIQFSKEADQGAINITCKGKIEYIDVRYKTSTSSSMEFFMIEDPVDQTYSVTAPMTGDGQWHVLTIDLWSNENVKNRSSITGWRWDWRFDADGTVDIDYIKIRK